MIPEVILSPETVIITAYPVSVDNGYSSEAYVFSNSIQDLTVGTSPHWLKAKTHYKNNCIKITFNPGNNTGKERDAGITIYKSGQVAGKVNVIQYSGEFIESRMKQLMQTPMNMDMGIALKFLAGKVKDIPEPFNFIAVIIVVILIALIGLILLVIRAAFINIPDPLPLTKPFLEPPNLPVLGVPVESQLILNQTYLCILYFVMESLK